jgi:hypothetical protein
VSNRQTQRRQSHTSLTAAGDPASGSTEAATWRDSDDKPLLRLAATLGIIGVALQVVMDRLHPHRVDPNDSAAVFREYADSHDWTLVHIGQFAGTLLIVIGLLALARSLSRQGGVAGALGVVGAVTGVLVAATFTIQMAVDGVALKAAVDAWTVALAPDKAAAFQVAESVRWTEKGLGGFFQMLQGATLSALGLSIALGNRYPKWLGWVGGLAGVTIIAGGTVTARTGFSAQAGLILAPATVLLAVFVVGTFILMWRHRSTGRLPAP